MKIRKLPFDYERLERELLHFMPCTHPSPVVARRRKTNGQLFFRLQCHDCGRPMSGQLAFAKVEALKRDGKQEKDWDEKLATDYALKRIRHSSPIQEAINLERQQIWWSDYSRYLESEEWKERSAGIIARAHGLCEKCGKRKAIHVHHLSYDRVGEERETDLQALCFQCHDEIHDGMLTIDRIHEEIMREISLEAPTLAAEAGALVATPSALPASAAHL